MFNPTGMIETDLLLLDIISYSREMANNKLSEHDAIVSETTWRSLMKKKGVPEAFFDIAYYFDVPEGFSQNFEKPKLVDTLSALENLLWRWKSPLQREWYPYLMGLKQDILLANGQQPLERIRKTQLQPLASQFEESGLNL